MMKPGITLSNTLAAVAGFFLASSMYGFDPLAFAGVAAGIALVIASACVANNMVDRDIDLRMKRTRGREVAAGNISMQNAFIYAVVLGISGFGSLALWTNWWTFALGVLAYVWYVVIYGIAKRKTPASTLIGAVCGALPPMAGYAAVTNNIDTVAFILFMMLIIWQMPHFYAIAMMRRDDYKKAGLPVWSVKYGMASTRKQIMRWVLAFLVVTPALAIVGATCDPYLLVMVGAGLYWAVQAMAYTDEPDEMWARRLFKSSIWVLLIMLFAIGIGGYI